DVVSRLQAKRNGRGWIANCPNHDDSTPSLSISEGNDGRVLLHCFAGCRTQDILVALSLETPDLFSRNGDGSTPAPARSIADPSGSVDPDPNGGISDRPAFDWQVCNEAFTDRDVERVASWRGYGPGFLRELRDAGLIGIYRNCVAFP